MRIVVLPVLVALVLGPAASLGCQEQQPDAAKEGLRGPVRTVEARRAEYVERQTGRLRGALVRTSETRFNEAGYAVDVNVFARPGTRTTSVYTTTAGWSTAGSTAMAG